MTTIGQDLFKSKSDEQAAPQLSTSVDANGKTPGVPKKAPRAFRFDEDTPDGVKKPAFKNSRLMFAVLGVSGVILAFAAYSMLNKKAGDVVKPLPFTETKIEESKLQTVSQLPFKLSDEPPPSRLAAASSPQGPASETVATGPLEPASDASSVPLVEPVAAVATVAVTTQAANKKSPQNTQMPLNLPSISHSYFSMVVKNISEKQLHAEVNGEEYFVKPGQLLPDGETVFVGFDRTTSIMRTSAGDHRIFMN